MEIVKLRFHLLAQTPVYLPIYKGSAFHGALGLAIKRNTPLLYQELFDPRSSANQTNSIPRPFVLLPPLEPQSEFPAGSTLICELTLFGRAVRNVNLYISAIDQLGRLNIKEMRGWLSISLIEVISLSGQPQTLYSAADERLRDLTAPISAAEIAAPWENIETASVTLEFQTRMRLQFDNRLVRTAPSFELLLARLLGRLSMIIWGYHGVSWINNEDKAYLLRQAKGVKIEFDGLHWDDWSRYSGWQKKWMKFGGLLGRITYTGNLSPFMPYLAVGEWLHIGSKTSFGLGKFSILD